MIPVYIAVPALVIIAVSVLLALREYLVYKSQCGGQIISFTDTDGEVMIEVCEDCGHTEVSVGSSVVHEDMVDYDDQEAILAFYRVAQNRRIIARSAAEKIEDFCDHVMEANIIAQAVEREEARS